MPSFQWELRPAVSPDSLVIAAINNTSSTSWLNTYRGSRGITYPLVYDSTSQIFQAYQVGTQYGNAPPTYIIIDTKGVIQYRVDDKFNRTSEIIAKVRDVLKNP
ncbi:MAG: AhpC/TSA family [Bacteroidetes bacterium]|nr:AhpC/TSA family [Bacteroidota bacterium]